MFAPVSLALLTLAATPDLTVEATSLSVSGGNAVQFAGDSGQGLVGVGATAVVQWNHLELGGTADASLALGSHNEGHTHVGLLAGAALDSHRQRFEALGEIGEHQISGIGGSLTATSTGETSAALPYVGLRLGYSIRSPHPVGFDYGFWAFARYDLAQAYRTVVVTQTCWDLEGSGCASSTQAANVGGVEVGVAFRLGFDLFRGQ